MDFSDKAVTLLWVREDFRTSDNHALTKAIEHAKKTKTPLIALYIWEGEKSALRPFGGAQSYWLHHALSEFSTKIHALNIPLFIEIGEAKQTLLKFCSSKKIQTLFWNRRYGDEAIRLDSDIKARLTQQGFLCNSFQGALLHDPRKITTGKGAPYRVYTPFWRNFSAQFEPTLPLKSPSPISADYQIKLFKSIENSPNDSVQNLSLLPKNPNWAAQWHEFWQPGENGAHSRLSQFLEEAIDQYKLGRDFPASPLTSKLSPHLRFGEITPNQIWYALGFHQENIEPSSLETFKKELVWREFAYHLLYHWPNLHQNNYNKKFDDFPWREDFENLRLWQRGETGYPIVDAGMRQLWQTGWMHNRVRMVVASFLVKHLRIDWRHGERWFWDCLVDADPASNPVSWQWVAGCGADAAPYFRIFNPYTQAQKFDPNAEYIKTYVHELQNIPAKEILAANAELAHYAPKIVDHNEARKNALAALKSIS